MYSSGSDTDLYVLAENDLYAPFSGLLKALNRETLENHYLIGEDPYGSGWIAEIEPAKPEGEAKALLNSAQYTKYFAEMCLACPKKTVNSRVVKSGGNR